MLRPYQWHVWALLMTTSRRSFLREVAAFVSAPLVAMRAAAQESATTTLRLGQRALCDHLNPGPCPTCGEMIEPILWGDGTHDDRQSLQALLDGRVVWDVREGRHRSRALDGSHALILRRRHRISGPLTVPNAVTVQFDTLPIPP